MRVVCPLEYLVVSEFAFKFEVELMYLAVLGFGSRRPLWICAVLDYLTEICHQRLGGMCRCVARQSFKIPA